MKEPESFLGITAEAIEAANARHDREHGHPYDYEQERIRPAWRESSLLRRGKLSDKKISQYEKAGWYSLEYKTSRKELMERKARKRPSEGNFVPGPDGRLIYRPL